MNRETIDMVNHPPHYGSHPSGIECIDITEICNFTIGNAIKYIWRAWDKGRLVEDLAKARWYLLRTEQNGCAARPPFKAGQLLLKVVTNDPNLTRAELLDLIQIGWTRAAVDLIDRTIEGDQNDDEQNQRPSGTKDMVTAIVAQTKEQATQLARDLGLDTRWTFGARCLRSMEGLRADRVLIHAEASIPDEMMCVIHALVLKSRGGIAIIRGNDGDVQ